MNNTFRIQYLDGLYPLSSNVYFIGEKDGVTYNIKTEDLQKEVLAHTKFYVGRTGAKGSNVLSVCHQAYDGRIQTMAEVTLQDGILSSVEYDKTTNYLKLHFNATDPQNSCISCNLSGLVDTYTVDTTGKGIHLCSDYGGDAHTFCLNYNEIANNMRFNTTTWTFEVKDSSGKIETKNFNVVLSS